MNIENITTYLKDHLAGSVAAVELLNHLITAYEGTAEAEGLIRLKEEVEGDQKLLRGLLTRFAGEENAIKKAGAWMAEKVLMLKVNTGNGDLGTLEALEVLVLGIEGKLRLWRSLEFLDVGLNLEHLQTAAMRQITEVETLRVQAARRALS